jgi:23S rRNA pseudouridine2605 synthase
MSPVKRGEARGFSRKPGKYSGLARALSKLGFCSRSQARILIEEGQVQVDGVVRRDPEFPVLAHTHRISVDQKPVEAAGKVYLMLNKPRGLVTTTADERGRDTVYSCFKDLPFVAPVGRLDKASEGLLLFTNDTEWADRVTHPQTHLEKTYHVQINCLADETLIQRLSEGLEIEGEFLTALRAKVLRQGEKNSWLEMVLDEGRNRHIRRLIEASGHTVLRLVRVSIGNLELGSLPKGNYRFLSREEVQRLGAQKGKVEL